MQEFSLKQNQLANKATPSIGLWPYLLWKMNIIEVNMKLDLVYPHVVQLRINRKKFR
jgi:hypothetical protein